MNIPCICGHSREDHIQDMIIGPAHPDVKRRNTTESYLGTCTHYIKNPYKKPEDYFYASDVICNCYPYREDNLGYLEKKYEESLK